MLPLAKPRIMHIITGLETGGAEMMLCKLVQNAESGWDHTVLSLTGPGALGQLLQQGGTRVISLNFRRGGQPLRSARALLQKVRELRPSVIQGWMYHGNLAAMFAQRLGASHSALAWSIRCAFIEGRNEKWLTRKLARMGAQLSHRPGAIIYNSRRSREQHAAHGYADQLGLVIPNGFDVGRFKPDAALRAAARERLGISQGCTAIGLLARVHPMKDHATLLRAAAKVVYADGGVVFVVAGKGVPDLRQQLPELVKAAGPRLILLPEESDTPAFMNALDICVLSSAWGEAFPNVLGEAMACGVPCVATDVGDCTDIVADTGLIVPPQAPEELARAILDVASLRPDCRRALGEKARARVAANYTLGQVRRRYEEVWNGLADRRSGITKPRSAS